MLQHELRVLNPKLLAADTKAVSSTSSPHLSCINEVDAAIQRLLEGRKIVLLPIPIVVSPIARPAQTRLSSQGAADDNMLRLMYSLQDVGHYSEAKATATQSSSRFTCQAQSSLYNTNSDARGRATHQQQ